MEARAQVPGADDDPADFDPLAEFHGQWNTRLADRYWPLLSRLFGKVECVSGRLVVAPTEASGNSYGEGGLIAMLRGPARTAGFVVYGSLNMSFGPDTWIEPDVCVLHRVPETAHRSKWVPADHFTMPVEFVSPSSRRADEIDKPARCADEGVPYFMRVRIDREKRTVSVTQLKLVHGEYKPISSAVTGERFVMAEPFDATFDVNELLEP